MPLYEYQCDACDHRFEKIQKFLDPLPDCPSCGGTVRKLLSSPAIQFKGSGFYITDYAKKPAPDTASTDKPASGGATADKASTGSGGDGSTTTPSTTSTTPAKAPAKAPAKE